MMAYTGITNKTIQDYIGIVSLTNGNTTTEYLTGSTLFGICKTASGTAEKVVEVEDFTTFSPTHGLTIHVLFLHTNESNKPDATTPTAPTLKISSGGTAYPIYQFKGTAAGYTPSTSWRDGAIVALTFIDTRYDDDSSEQTNYWVMNSSIDTGADGLASVNLNNVQNADDLKAIEALAGTSGYLKKTAANTWALQTTTDATSSVAGITTVGASGGAAAYSHTHGNITSDGKMNGSTVSGAVSSTDKFLREDGTWVAPAYTINTDEKVAQTANTENKEFSILLKNTNDNNNETNGVKFANTNNKQVTINPSTGQITAPGGLAGNASTATNFSNAKTIALTGNVTGSASGGNADNGWSIATTIGTGVVTNAMLAGSIDITKLNAYSITINGTSKNLGQSFTLSDIGLNTALRFAGTVAANSVYKPSIGSKTGVPTLTDNNNYTPAVGDVVLYDSEEYACISATGTAPNITYTWELLGRNSSFALSTEVIKKADFINAYQLIYSSAVGTPAFLNANTTSTKKFLSMKGTGSDGAAPEWSTVTKSDVGLSSVTDHPQVTSLSWDKTNKKITYKVSEGNDTDIVSFVAGSNISLTGANNQLTIANTYSYTLTVATSDALGGIKIGYSESNSGSSSSRNYAVKLSSEKAYVNVPWTDTKVTQNILATSVEDTYPLLVSAYKTSENTTTATTVNRVAAIFVQPSTGTITATKFVGDGSGLTVLPAAVIKTALGYNSNSTNTKFLHESGDWKTLKVSVTANNSGSVVTSVSHSGGSFPSLGTTGKAATFSVNGGVLTITAGSDAALNGGSFPTVSMSKANLSVSYE